MSRRILRKPFHNRVKGPEVEAIFRVILLSAGAFPSTKRFLGNLANGRALRAICPPLSVVSDYISRYAMWRWEDS